MKQILLALAIVAFLPSAFAATAVFTGNMQQVQTVTGLFAWRCEYDYFGQKIYRLFRNSCPGMIEVE